MNDKPGRRLMEAREWKIITQEELAQATGISLVQIIRAEAGKAKLSHSNIRMISMVLGINGYLLSSTFEEDEARSSYPMLAEYLDIMPVCMDEELAIYQVRDGKIWRLWDVRDDYEEFEPWFMWADVEESGLPWYTVWDWKPKPEDAGFYITDMDNGLFRLSSAPRGSVRCSTEYGRYRMEF